MTDTRHPLQWLFDLRVECTPQEADAVQAYRTRVGMAYARFRDRKITASALNHTVVSAQRQLELAAAGSPRFDRYVQHQRTVHDEWRKEHMAVNR